MTTAKTSKATAAGGATAKPKKKVRRKKPSTGASASSRGSASASNAQSIWSAASAAQKELTQQSAQAAARLWDPLWYRADEPLQRIARDSFMVSGGSGVLPEQIDLVEAALAENHLTRTDVTPQAFACLLEQARRYALELLADAQDYAYSANRNDVTRADLLLAREMRADQPMATATQQPRLMSLAGQVNRAPLPPIPTHCYNGVVLPPEEHQLTARTFDVISGAQVAQRMVAAPPAASTKKSTAPKPSYGASRGRQIPIQLNTGENSATGATLNPASSSAPLPTAYAAPSGPVIISGVTMTTSAEKQPGDAGTKRKLDQIQM
jgi:histone H3/H4